MKYKFFCRSANFIFLFIVLFILYFPMLIVSIFSFNSGKSTTEWAGFTLDWYLKLINNESLMKALWVSLSLALSVTVLSVIIGTICSFALHKTKNKINNLLIPAIHLPVFTPEIIVGIAFMQIFSTLGIKFGMATLLLSHLSFCVPFVIIVVSARFKGMDNNLEDAARDLGASAWQAFFQITIPQLLPGIISGAALSFIMSFDDVVISFFMSGASNTTLPVKVYSMLRVGISPEINALTTLTIVMTVVCICILNRHKSVNNL